jgi:hypothetical protein
MMSSARLVGQRTAAEGWLVPDHNVLFGASLGQWNGADAAAAAGFIYRSPDDTPADEALARWATEIVPAVREAITR